MGKGEKKDKMNYGTVTNRFFKKKNNILKIIIQKLFQILFHK
jgi:hypothetical protein